MSDNERERRCGELSASNLRVVRVGHGGNCSSVGSVVDTLFISAAVGGAMLAAICAAMKAEPITVVGSAGEARRARDAEPVAPSKVGAVTEAPTKAVAEARTETEAPTKAVAEARTETEAPTETVAPTDTETAHGAADAADANLNASPKERP